ncbi:hypothetical protein [Curtobacterium sp. MCJR17_043]|uniref:hypothetical protein n=1 Tax=Curtobacterium sp. MCJR17_043 TaxID=2175660 RepID=UPI0024DF6006|nr:hypothetical protein [Curtobacterium sp. MCJR17_043]WIB35916.1 hypothetical protein DEJ15_00980 [Curtobacterium sp. MCJR17_043]
MRLRAAAVALVAASALVLTACTGTGAETGTGGPDRATGTGSPSADGPDREQARDQARALAALGAVPKTTAGTMRLADGLVPPTNRWFSGLVYGAAPQPVFPTPISWQVTDDGFAAGLPVVSATEKTIAGGAVQQVGLDLGADRTLVSAYDQVSVTVEHRDGDRVVGHTVLAQGSPLVSYTAEAGQTVRATSSITATGDGPDGTTTGTIAADGRTWGVVTSGDVSGSAIELGRGGHRRPLPRARRRDRQAGACPVHRGGVPVAAGHPRPLVDRHRDPRRAADRSRVPHRGTGRHRHRAAARSGRDGSGLHGSALRDHHRGRPPSAPVTCSGSRPRASRPTTGWTCPGCPRPNATS